MLRTNSCCTSAGQRGRDPIRIDERVVEALGLEEDLVRVAVREALHLVLDRRAIARAPPLDRAGEQRRAVEVGADDVVRPLVGPRDRAAQLRLPHAVVQSADIVQRRSIARLLLEPRPVDRPPVEPRRRPGLQPALRQGRRRGSAPPSARDARSAAPAALDHLLADEHARVEERACGDDHGAARRVARRRSRARRRGRHADDHAAVPRR